MALLLQLEEGYGLVPSEDGMGLTVDPKAPHAPKLAQSIKTWPKSVPSSSAANSTRTLTPTGKPLSDIFPGELTFPCEQPPVLRSCSIIPV